jgi:hypothetical protein
MAVKRGYKAKWNYNGEWKERKVAPGRWTGIFNAIKKRPAKGEGSIKAGDIMRWRINGIQSATKLENGEYATSFKFSKRYVGGKFKK